jgi:UDPglucose 6-dehydrogenase
VTSTVETAELIKYAANAFLATKVTFINELSRLCELAGADIHELALGVGLDNRIGSNFFTAGPGFGGSCFPRSACAGENRQRLRQPRGESLRPSSAPMSDTSR